MSTKYERYMDRQSVSPDLHARLLALEQQEKKVIRPRRWQRWAAMAAAVVLVAGAGWFAAGRLGSSASREMTALEPVSVAAAGEEDNDLDMAAEAAVESVETEESAEASEDSALPADVEALQPFATDYLGDAPSVVRIVSGMTYPEGWAYDHVELHTEQPPYTLDICLSGSGETDFGANAETAFALIGNLDAVRFLDAATGDVMEEYSR